jgi:PAS domain S-box-containing protein
VPRLRLRGDGATHPHPLDRATRIVETAADPMFVIDPEERTIFANRAAERTFGGSQAELSGKVLPEIMQDQHCDNPVEDRVNPKEPCRQAMAAQHRERPDPSPWRQE